MIPYLEAANRFGRKGLIATVLAGSLMFGGTAWAVEPKSTYGLDPKVQVRLEQLQNLAKKEGIKFKVTEGYRSQARQNELYAQGRTKPGRIITKTTKSRHTARTAFDIAIIKGNKASWEAKDYTRIGQLGKQVGLTWGGEWKMRDLVHFELAYPTVIKAAQVRKVIKKHAILRAPKKGLVNRAMHNSKISSKGGSASYKAVKFLRKLIAR